ncbi:MAG TPA: class II aldolase/adducin family protein [Candidatus Eisenbacteria bacterium]|nr:class II aldolase/adducin family protein [Candidatus Eisenbacteria bacterium]
MKNIEVSLKQFMEFSNSIGKRLDYVQGGGGNTSFKVDQDTMLIKASGYYLTQVSENDGFAILNYPKIQEFFYSVDLIKEEDIEASGSKTVMDSKLTKEGFPELRPSVEAGFHSILGKWVAHTHSVYTNIVLCSETAQELLEKIFSKIDYIYVPYVNPGSRLTVEILKEIEKFQKDNQGRSPMVIFMQNHGVIVHAEEMQECFDLHQEVNQIICDYFSIDWSDYPISKIEKQAEDEYVSATTYLINTLKKGEYTAETLLSDPLYPDQIVYLEDTLNNTAKIDKLSGQITYKIPYKEALLLEQSLTAILYIMNNIQNQNLKIKYMHGSEQDFIKNWESEKYRKELSRE